MSATTSQHYHRTHKLGAPHAQNPIYHHWEDTNHLSHGHSDITGLDQSAGSDCGSSSGLGGMKEDPTGEGAIFQGNEDPSGSSPDEGEASDEHDEESSTYDQVQNAKEVRTSSKQSATSSGKGSSTGTSPTGSNSKVGNGGSSVKRRSLHQLHRRNRVSGMPTAVSSSVDDFPCTSGGAPIHHQKHMSLSGSIGVVSSTPSSQTPLSASLHQQMETDGASTASLCGSQGQNSGDYSLPPPYIYHQPQPHHLQSIAVVSGELGGAVMPPNTLSLTSSPGPNYACSNSNQAQFHPQMVAPSSCSLLVTGPPPTATGGPVYTMTMGPYGQAAQTQAAAPMRYQLPHRSNSSSPYAPTTPAGGGGGQPRTAVACGTTQPSSASLQDTSMSSSTAAGGRNSVSPSTGAGGGGQAPVSNQQHNGLNNSVSNGQPSGGSISSGQHSLYVHVNFGETLTVKFGNEIQHITGPATVRMVSHSEMPPNALPLHVPVGHRIDQIVDEGGFLKHVILSPETPGPPTGGPFAAPATLAGLSAPTAPPPTVEHNTPVPPPYSAVSGPNSGTGGARAPLGPTHCPPPPPGAAYVDPQGYVHHPQTMLHQPIYPNRPDDAPHYGYGRTPGVVANNRWSADDVKLKHIRHDGPLPAPFIPAASQQAPPQATVPQQTATSTGGVTGGGGVGGTTVDGQTVAATTTAVENGREDSRSGASATEDEDLEKMREMLNRIQSPQVCEIGSREVSIQWQAFDTSEASASGGPFPHIDVSEFTYEIALYEGNPDQGKLTHKQNCVPPSGEQTPQLKLADLKPDNAYFVRLRARLIERGLDGDPSTPIGFRTKPSHPDKPYPPRLLKRDKKWLTVQWRRPCDNGAVITAYHLYCDIARDDRDESTFSEVYTGTGMQKKVMGLEPNTVYRLRLAASNKFGKSDYSDTLLIQTAGAAPPPPEPPQLLQARPTSLQLAWAKRAGDDCFALQMEDPTTGYGFQPWINNTTETVAHVEQLARNQEYRFRLVAANDDGQSQASEPVAYRTSPSKPAAPAKPYLKDRVKSTSIFLAWDPPKDTGGADITLYQLDYSVDSQSQQRQIAEGKCDMDDKQPTATTVSAKAEQQWRLAYSGSDRTYNLSGLQPGCPYQFRLCCVGPAGPSAFSDALCVTTTPVAPSQCPRPELAHKPKANWVHVKWNTPSTDGGSEITEYELTVDPFPSADGAAITPTSPGGSLPVYARGPKTDCQLSNLLPGRRYQMRVRAVNAAGSGHWSDSLDVNTAAGPPDQPTNLRLNPDQVQTPRALHLCWQPPQNNNGAAVMEYRLFCLVVPSGCVVTDEECEWKQIYCGSASQTVVKDLTPATSYAFKVQGGNSAGVGCFSVLFECATDADVPEMPTGLEAEAQSTDELEVSWDKPVDNGSPLEAFLVHVRATTSDNLVSPPPDSAGRQIEVSADKNRLTIGDLRAEMEYRVRVAAVNALGKGPFSSAVRATTYSNPPPPPTLEVQSWAHNALRLRWHDAKAAPFEEAYTYSVEVENKAGSFSPVYEGPNRNHKAQRLQENTLYRFRIRAASPTGGVGVWSEPVAFKTPRAPPPSIKAEPKITAVGTRIWQVEWQSVKMVSVNGGGASSVDKIIYAVQTSVVGASPTRQHPGSSSSDEWKTMYRGPSQSFVISDLAIGTYRVRVMPIRISQERMSTPRRRSSDKGKVNDLEETEERNEVQMETNGEDDVAADPMEQAQVESIDEKWITVETNGPPSKHALINNMPERREEKQSSSEMQRSHRDSVKTDEAEALTGPRQWSEAHLSAMLLIGFSLLAIAFAYGVMKLIEE